MHIKWFFKLLIFASFLVLCSCDPTPSQLTERPAETWVHRSVLDGRPRMITLNLHPKCLVAYDLSKCGIYKIWRGGISWEGAVFTDVKNVQPTTWGEDYYSDELLEDIWHIETSGVKQKPKVLFKGYVIKNQQIFFRYDMVLSEKDTIRLEERPEFVQSKTGQPGLERMFKVSNVPKNVSVFLKSKNQTIKILANQPTFYRTFFDTIARPLKPDNKPFYDHMGKYWMERSDCFTCHEIEDPTVGPSFKQIAQRYSKDKNSIDRLVQKIKLGGNGLWGKELMNPHPEHTEEELKTMVDYILSLNQKSHLDSNSKVTDDKKQDTVSLRPGFGMPLNALHPSYDLYNIRKKGFNPKVGGLAFLSNGGLLVTTWDKKGEVYLLKGVETGDADQISVQRIASGLAEPLGIEVVDDKIFVLQKHELTQLIDLDGDDIIDEYRAICNSFGVTSDFHEFAFGLVYKDGYFYANLSLAMRPLNYEKQLPDRGKTIKIGLDGSFEWVNHGLRQPDGIGLGVDGEIFTTDNQGQWLPANKLIHIRHGDFHGMRWLLKDSLPDLKMTPPAVWLPEHEIANSPSEPLIMKDGPYQGQMLYGDVSHGGIKRVFLEKINGAYQGCVFRFTQGLEAGVHRLRWGPDGALYIGGIGMVGGWSWKGTKYGLQRMKYNEKPTFEMLAVRARPFGLEIEFTEPLKEGQGNKISDYLTQQWWYLPTEAYGGPKMDLENMTITKVELSKNRTKVNLTITGLKKDHVIYIRLKDDLKSASGQLLWSSETWYTLNNIPKRDVENM